MRTRFSWPDGSLASLVNSRGATFRRARVHPGPVPAPVTAPRDSRFTNPPKEVPMDVGQLLVFQNWFEDVSDEEVFVRELEMGVRAEELGFDSVWSAEHHFDDYSMCPDNLQIMAYI